MHSSSAAGHVRRSSLNTQTGQMTQATSPFERIKPRPAKPVEGTPNAGPIPQEGGAPTLTSGRKARLVRAVSGGSRKKTAARGAPKPADD